MTDNEKILKYYWGVPIRILTDLLYPKYKNIYPTKNTIKFIIHDDIRIMFFPKKEVKVRKGRFIEKEVRPYDLCDLQKKELALIIKRINNYISIAHSVDVTNYLI